MDYTKLGATGLEVFSRMRPGPNGAGLSRKAILSEIDLSLRRLGTDRVDRYQIHPARGAVPPARGRRHLTGSPVSPAQRVGIFQIPPLCRSARPGEERRARLYGGDRRLEDSPAQRR